MIGLDEMDPALVRLLRVAGDRWGPLGVALAAAQLTDPAAVVAGLTGDGDGDAQPIPAGR